MTETTQLPNLHFVFGGARSGKSRFSENLVKEAGDCILYVATAQILDDEMRHRIEAHRARRPSCWDTLEAYFNTFDKLTKKMESKQYEGVIIDCIAIWTSNLIIQMPEMTSEEYAYSILTPELEKLFNIIRSYPDTRFVVVSNEVGEGIIPSYPLGRRYRDVLGRINQYIAAVSTSVNFMIAGIPLKLK